MFNPDKPISSTEEDKLGRSVFSENLATALMDYTNKESLVLGFYGAWGSGKSSLINMTLERIILISDGLPANQKLGN